MDKLAPDSATAPLSTDPDYAARALEWCSGTYSSGWSTLKMACASCLQATARHTAEDIESAGRIKEKNNQRGAVGFFIGIGYSRDILGPALATVILSATSLESFLRIGYQVSLEFKRRKKQRAEGFDELIRPRLREFDSETFMKRIGMVIRETQSRPLPTNDPLRQRLKHLSDYRNECAHDAPILRMGDGRQVKAPGQRGERMVLEGIGPYERLGLTLRPVRLRHALHAVETHDRLVEHIYETTAIKEWANQMRYLDLGAFGPTIKKCVPGTIPWKQLRSISDHWEKHVEPMAECSVQEMEEFTDTIKRQQNVKIVK